jgi:creatinine amidohydrolase/Fe(II)-dependent formamide hydrolase-like protein
MLHGTSHRRPGTFTALAVVAALAGTTVLSTPASAPVRHATEMTSTDIAALDRSRTVVLLPGGILEEHGPWLPTFADGYLNERLTRSLATAIVAARPGWTVLVFPTVPLGNSGANDIGGRMVHLAGLLPIFSAIEGPKTDAAKQEEGLPIHSGMDETSWVLHLKPTLVKRGWQQAPPHGHADMERLTAIARDPTWPGYFGSPRLATAAHGAAIWKAIDAETTKTALAIRRSRVR